VSGTLDSVDWNAEFVRGDLEKTIRQLMEEPGATILRAFRAGSRGYILHHDAHRCRDFPAALRGEVCLEAGMKIQIESHAEGMPTRQ
jgi:hypothetical protein